MIKNILAFIGLLTLLFIPDWCYEKVKLYKCLNKDNRNIGCETPWFERGI